MIKFWFEKIQKPIIGLAPMHGFTKSEFRLLCRQSGADVVYSEMVASEGIIRRAPKVMEMLDICKEERPVVIQIFGNNPESMAKAARIIEEEIKPDGIDINFGCPVQKAGKQGFGAIQLNNPEKAAEIVMAVSKVLKTTPLSVKIRFPSKNIEDTINFVEVIKKAGAKLVAIHGRTLTQKYRGQADWEHIQKVKDSFPDFPILGNGDIRSLDDLKKNIGSLDGVLVGRAAKIRPAVFQELRVIK